MNRSEIKKRLLPKLQLNYTQLLEHKRLFSVTKLENLALKGDCVSGTFQNKSLFFEFFHLKTLKQTVATFFFVYENFLQTT